MKTPTWDEDKSGLISRKYLSSEEILDSVKNTGKVTIPSNDFIFPSVRSNVDSERYREILASRSQDIGAMPDLDRRKYLESLKKQFMIRKGTMDSVGDATWDIAQTYEPKLYQALSEGIRKTYGFNPRHKTKDISKELASSMGVPNVPIEYKYVDGVAGRTDLEKIQLNPQHLGEMGREAVIAHELRHIKEGPGSSGSTLGKPRKEGLEALQDAFSLEGLLKSKQGKDLQQFKKGGGFKEGIDVLDIASHFEGKHFKTSFIKENLRRVAKGLPIIGSAATVVGGLGYSDIAGAAGDFLASPIGGVEEMGVSGEQKQLDRRYQETIKRRSQWQK